MAGNQNYQTQIEALRELEAYLHGVSSEMQNLMRAYSEKVSGLADRGLPVRVHDKVKIEFYMPSQNLVTQSCAITQEQAIPYLRQQIRLLEQALHM